MSRERWLLESERAAIDRRARHHALLAAFLLGLLAGLVIEFFYMG